MTENKNALIVSSIWDMFYKVSWEIEYTHCKFYYNTTNYKLDFQPIIRFQLKQLCKFTRHLLRC
jgi:hypothetical protein